MPVISLTATVRCDGKDCDTTATSDDVSSYIANEYGQEYSYIEVYPPNGWGAINTHSWNVKYYCPSCKKKKNK